MFKGFGNGYFALGLIIGVGLALIFAIWFGEPFYEIEASRPDADPQRNHNRQGFGPIPPAFISTQDTLAQWLMAFFSIIATGFSIFAVVLVRDTLNTSIEANDIMRLEQRPWLVIESKMHGHFSFHEVDVLDRDIQVCWSMWFDALNKGKSPAQRFKFATKVVCKDSWFDTERDFIEFVENTPARYIRRGGPLFAGEST